MVLVTAKSRYPICFDCQKGDLQGEVKDPVFKKLFDIPDNYYVESMFLRSIKINYLKYGKLTDRQIEFFIKAVDKMNKEKSSPAN